jgi:hypothetical protein
MKISVRPEEETERVVVLEYKYAGAPKMKVSASPMVLEAHSQYDYFEVSKLAPAPLSPSEKGAPPLLLSVHAPPPPCMHACLQKRDPWAGLRAQLFSPMTWMLIMSLGMAFVFPKMLGSLGE